VTILVRVRYSTLHTCEEAVSAAVYNPLDYLFDSICAFSETLQVRFRETGSCGISEMVVIR
jgi:hypothetical protein